MDHAHHRQDALDLVPLEVPDHVPADQAWLPAPLVVLGKLTGACEELIDAAFAHVKEPCLRQRADRVHVHRLGHRDDGYLAGGSAASGAGSRDLFPNTGKVALDLLPGYGHASRRYHGSRSASRCRG